jgi:hypothetical protein
MYIINMRLHFILVLDRDPGRYECIMYAGDGMNDGCPILNGLVNHAFIRYGKKLHLFLDPTLQSTLPMGKIPAKGTLWRDGTELNLGMTQCVQNWCSNLADK